MGEPFISSVLARCCREKLVREISDAILSGSRAILLIGAPGSGKSLLADSIICHFSQNAKRAVISQKDVYGISERQSISCFIEKFNNHDYLLIEELSDFSMHSTPRDMRVTFSLSHLIEESRNTQKFIVATTRDASIIDPGLLRYFKDRFYLRPLDIDERINMLKSLPNGVSTPLIDKFRSLDGYDQQRELMKHYPSLNPSELLSSDVLVNDEPLSAVAGVDGIMKKLEFLVLKPITDPELFRNMGVRPPRGILLTGPAGIGKSLIAKSIGNASKVSFFKVTGVEIITKEVGESEKRLHSIFEKARASAPSIILFDDIDAIAPKRSFGFNESISEAADRILTTLLVETDGLGGRDDGVVILATTSRLDAIDPALTRPGRFDYIIDLPYPDANARGQIFDLYAKDIPIEDADKVRQKVIESTAQMTGAEILGIVREAAMHTLRKNIESQVIPSSSFDDVISSMKKDKNMTHNQQLIANNHSQKANLNKKTKFKWK